jgi:sulfur relay (sulfurtransferase) DsrC/TusE family protein
MHKIIQLISNFFNHKNISPSIKVHAHWMNLVKTQIIQKVQSFEIFKKRATKQRTHFFNNLTKKNYVQWVQNV